MNINQNPESQIPESWARYGLPGKEMLELNDRVLELLWSALEEKGIKIEAERSQQMTVSAGFNILLITIFDLQIAKYAGELEKQIVNNIPAGCSYEITIDEATGSQKGVTHS